LKGDEGYNQNFGVRIASFLAGRKEDDDGEVKGPIKAGLS